MHREKSAIMQAGASLEILTVSVIVNKAELNSSRSCAFLRMSEQSPRTEGVKKIQT
jgi:hypothetical protein